jgi:hypothetical protein
MARNMMNLKTYLLFLFCGIGSVAFAQVPVTDLYLVQLTEQPAGTFHVHSPEYLSDFNAGGYTSQPFFASDQELYISVRKKGDDQNDLYAIHVDNQTIRKVTDTPESEFSPALLPGNGWLACVRQTVKGPNRQTLVAFPRDQSSNGQTLLPEREDIGYFCPLNEETIALFLVNDESRLALANIETGKTEFSLSNIGRCLRKHPEGDLVYVHKYTDAYWYLKIYDFENKRSSIITETLSGEEDFCLDAEGRIFMGKGSKLFVHPGKEDGQWAEIGDLSAYGIRNITRLALNGDNQLALISTRD